MCDRMIQSKIKHRKLNILHGSVGTRVIAKINTPRRGIEFSVTYCGMFLKPRRLYPQYYLWEARCCYQTELLTLKEFCTLTKTCIFGTESDPDTWNVSSIFDSWSMEMLLYEGCIQQIRPILVIVKCEGTTFCSYSNDLPSDCGKDHTT